MRVEQAQFDGVAVELNLKRCVFIDVGFKEAQFSGRLTHSRLERCYLRKASFRGLDLTGTTFVKCNLDHAVLSSCKLDYVVIDDCDVDYRSFLENLPPQPNLRRRLLRSLRVNAATRRDVEERDLLLAELRAERDELRNTFLGSNAYFRSKPALVRVRAFGLWMAHQFQRALWGYGLQIWALTRAAAVLIAVSSATIWFLEVPFLVADKTRSLSVLEALLLTLASFSTVGLEGMRPVSMVGTLFTVTQGVAGASFLGLLAATVYRKIAR